MRSVVEAQAAPLVDGGVRAQALGIAAAEFGEIRVKLVLRKPLGSRCTSAWIAAFFRIRLSGKPSGCLGPHAAFFRAGIGSAWKRHAAPLRKVDGAARALETPI